MGEREAMDGGSPRRAGLRSQAEQRLHTGTTEHDLAASEADARAMVHELQVHQIELEMQNEELQRAQAEAREASEKYCDLFDFAPVGYFLWDQEGRILEVNLAGAALLGRDRGAVIHKRFGQFVATEHRARFADFCRGCWRPTAKQTCEVKLVADGPGTGTPGRGRAGRGHCRPRPPGGHPVPWVGEALPCGGHRHQPAEARRRVGGSQPGPAIRDRRAPSRGGGNPQPCRVPPREPQSDPSRLRRRTRVVRQPAGRQTPGNDGLASGPNPARAVAPAGSTYPGRRRNPRVRPSVPSGTHVCLRRGGQQPGGPDESLRARHHRAQAGRRGTRDRGGIPAPGE